MMQERGEREIEKEREVRGERKVIVVIGVEEVENADPTNEVRQLRTVPDNHEKVNDSLT